MLTGDFVERIGLVTCERALLGHSAKEEASLRSDSRVFDSFPCSAVMSVQGVVLSKMMRSERAKRTVTQATCHET